MTVPCPSNYAIGSYKPGVSEPFYQSREALLRAFFVLTVPLDPYDGMRLTLVALIIVVLGGVGSLPGVLGMAEVVTGFLLGPAWSPVVFWRCSS
jgi:hypothetical protein